MPIITDLPLLTAPADDDKIYIVDVSDNTDGNGTSKQIKKSDLVGARMVSLGTLSRVSGVDAAGTFSWSGIPAIGNRLVLKGYLRSSVAVVTSDVLYAYYNGDTTPGNYKRLSFETVTTSDGVVANAGQNTSALPNTASVTAAGTVPSDSYSVIWMEIEGYADPIHKIRRTISYYRRTATIVGRSEHITTWTASSAAIDTLLITTDGGEGLFGKLTLYVEE